MNEERSEASQTTASATSSARPSRAERVLRHELPALAGIDDQVGHARVDHARGDAIGADAARAVLDGDRPGQELHAGLRGVVSGVLGPRADARDRGEVDDRAPLLQVGQRGPADVERPREVDGNRQVPLLDWELADGLPGRVDRGSAHHRVETAERFRGLPHRALDLAPAADVGRQGHRLLAELGPQRIEALPIPREEGKARALPREGERDRSTETAGRPGHERPPRGQQPVHSGTA